MGCMIKIKKPLKNKVKQVSNYTPYEKYNFTIFVVPKFDFCKILSKIFLNFAKKKKPLFLLTFLKNEILCI